MWRLKGCPKCKGDLCLTRDIDGSYEQCLQCGYTREVGYVRDLRSILRDERESIKEEEEPVLSGRRRRHRR